MNINLLNDLDKLNDMLEGDYMLIDFMDGHVIYSVQQNDDECDKFDVWMNDEETTLDSGHLQRCTLYKSVDDEE